MSPLLGRPGLHGSHLVRRALLLAVSILIASAPLSILLAGSSWFVLTAMAVVCVIGTGVLLRILLRSSVLVPLLQLAVAAGLIITLQRLRGLIPIGDGPRGIITAQDDIIVAGFQELAGSWPPVVLQGPGAVVVLLLISLVVLGLDLMFLDLGWHTPTALVLMGFMLAPALQQPAGGPWWTLLGPVVAGLLILTARTLHGDTSYLEGDQRPQAGPLPRGGRTAAAVAVCCLLVAGTTLPLSRALPQTAPPRIPLSLDVVNSWQGRNAPAPGPVMIDDSVSVRQDLLRGEEHEVLRYTTTDETPSYLRLHTMYRYEDGDFVTGPGMPPAADGAPAPFSDLQTDHQPRDERTDHLASTEISLTGLGGSTLPMPQNVRGLFGPMIDGTSVVPGDPGQVQTLGGVGTDGFQYGVAHEPRPTTPEQLRAVPADQLRQPLEMGVITGEIPQVTVDLADRLAEEAQAENAYDTAVAYQEFFRTTFAYSLTVRTPPGADPVETFLEDRIGYCEQFAATFALMMTSQGYPTRVVIGFTAGQRDGDTWVVTNHNAHAWPEVWFGPEHGWVPFEPTPPAATSGVNPPDHTDPEAGTAQEDIATPDEEELPTEQDVPEVEQTEPTPETEDPTPGTDDADQGGGEDAGDGAGAQPWGVLLGLLGLGAAAAAVVWAQRRQAAAREQRWVDGAEAGQGALAALAWSQLGAAVQARQQRVRWLGWTGWYGRPPVHLRLDPALPPEEAVAALVDRARDGRIPVEEQHYEAAARLGRAVHVARYAPGGGAGAPAEPAGGADGGGTASGGDPAAAEPVGGALRQDVQTLTELLTRAPSRRS
ncbi:MAG: cysteine protease [Brachybacterium faecium]|nr:MAG: cysteine protease [Brachybacterium faecium]